ncbi:MAG: glycosyltransferase [Acidimicrobiales bacterium]
MVTPTHQTRPAAVDPVAATLDVVVPVYNEEADLAPSVERLVAHLDQHVPYRATVTIADNASTDGTWAVARSLAARHPRVRAVHLDQKGRGRALNTVWSASDADVLVYMDVDLSTDLNALLPLVAPLVSGHSDLAIGTRLDPASRVVRGAKRELISRSYNVLLRRTLAVHFSDAQCGFKAITAAAARRLLPLVEDTGWFFDTELLILAERAGLRIHEVPVDWIDDADSRVDIVSTATADLRGVSRLLRGFATGAIPVAAIGGELGREPTAPELDGVPTSLFGQVVRFALIGVASTVAYLLAYVLLRHVTGAQLANTAALAGTAVANTAANRRLTFGLRGRSGVVRHHATGIGAYLTSLALTAGALAGLHLVVDHPSRYLEVAMLIAANGVATVIRFVALRLVIGGHRSPAGTA